MRVLILSQYYYPEPVEKVHDLARGLVRLGHDVQVITGFPCYPTGAVYPGYRQSMGMEQILDGVVLTRVPQFPDHSDSALKRAVYYLSFALSAATFGLARVRQPDIILVYQAALPVGLAGWILSRLHRIPLVLDVVDLWPESVVASGMLNSRVLIRLLRQTARFVYRKAHRINAVTNGFKHSIASLGIAEDKITVIHNWMPEETYRRVAADPMLAIQEGLNNCFNVMYAGTMGPVQDLGTVLKAAERLVNLSDVQFVLIGDGLEYGQLKEQVHAKELNNVRLLGRRPPEMMPSYYALADVLLVHLKPDLLSRVSIPSKTFAYMASGRPIIMAVQGDAEDLVRETGCGLAVEPSAPDKLAEAVRALYEMPAPKREAMGHASYRAYRDKYSSQVQIGKVSALLEEIVHELKQPVDRQEPEPFS